MGEAHWSFKVRANQPFAPGVSCSIFIPRRLPGRSSWIPPLPGQRQSHGLAGKLYNRYTYASIRVLLAPGGRATRGVVAQLRDALRVTRCSDAFAVPPLPSRRRHPLTACRVNHPLRTNKQRDLQKKQAGLDDEAQLAKLGYTQVRRLFGALGYTQGAASSSSSSSSSSNSESAPTPKPANPHTLNTQTTRNWRAT